jgi:hypothetical protein
LALGLLHDLGEPAAAGALLDVVVLAGGVLAGQEWWGRLRWRLLGVPGPAARVLSPLAGSVWSSAQRSWCWPPWRAGRRPHGYTGASSRVRGLAGLRGLCAIAPGRTSREPGNPADLPTAAQISELLGRGDFLDFQQQLESYHDEVHVWVGGTMAEIPFAAYDPVFFAHHVMIDRTWRLWQLRHPTAGVPRDLLDEALPPFNITVAQTIEVTALGYDYASFSSRTTIGR